MEHLLSFVLYVHSVAEIGNWKGHYCQCYVTDKESGNQCDIIKNPQARDGYKLLTIVDQDRKPTNGEIALICIPGEN